MSRVSQKTINSLFSQFKQIRANQDILKGEVQSLYRLCGRNSFMEYKIQSLEKKIEHLDVKNTVSINEVKNLVKKE
jgi:hypothetical protein